MHTGMGVKIDHPLLPVYNRSSDVSRLASWNSDVLAWGHGVNWSLGYYECYTVWIDQTDHTMFR